LVHSEDRAQAAAKAPQRRVVGRPVVAQSATATNAQAAGAPGGKS
jgi:hypothetical protein